MVAKYGNLWVEMFASWFDDIPTSICDADIKMLVAVVFG
jgi:hypothetical protein